jgi:putative transposase
MKAVEELSPHVGTSAACHSLGVSRATYYRKRRPSLPASAVPRPKSPRSLDEQERQQVLDALDSEPFADKAPAEVYATLLDQGRYLCSIRTMYRVLDSRKEVRERRDQLRHPTYHKPQLVATAPNQVWSWDITKLLGPAKWTYFHLYVILDIFSRYVVGWMLASRESEHLAERLIRATVIKEGVVRDQLTIHSDRGPSMRSQTVAQLLATLGIVSFRQPCKIFSGGPAIGARGPGISGQREDPLPWRRASADISRASSLGDSQPPHPHDVRAR